MPMPPPLLPTGSQFSYPVREDDQPEQEIRSPVSSGPEPAERGKLGARSERSARRSLHEAYQEQEERRQLDALLQPAPAPAEFLQNLPCDISALQALATQHGYQLPAIINRITQSQGYESLTFPCPTLGQVWSRLSVLVELKRRIDRRPDNSDNQFIRTALRHFGIGYRYVMLIRGLKNIYDIGQTLLQHPPGDGNRTLLVARDLAACAIHYSVANDIQIDNDILTRIENMDGLAGLEGWDPDALRQSYEAKKIAVQAKEEADHNLLTQDIPQAIVGFLTYVLVDSVIRSAIP